MRVLTNVVTERAGEGQDREGGGERASGVRSTLFSNGHTLCMLPLGETRTRAHTYTDTDIYTRTHTDTHAHTHTHIRIHTQTQTQTQTQTLS